MPNYHRILVSYPKADSADWSVPHWCDIELDENQVVHVRVAPANRNSEMPEDDDFLELDGISSRKLRVFDFNDEANPTYCLGLAQLVDPASYLRGSLNIKDLPPFKLFRFDFSKQNVMLSGQAWDPTGSDAWTSTGSIGKDACYKHEEIKRDRRFSMRGDADYNTIQYKLAVHNEELEPQYTAWNNKKAEAAAQEQLAKDELLAAQVQEEEEEKQQNVLLEQWKSQDRNTVNLNSDGVGKHPLNQSQIEMVKQVLTPLLLNLKQASPTQEDYCKALLFVLNRGNPLGQYTRDRLEHEQDMAIRAFHEFLYHSDMAPYFPQFYDQDGRAKENQPLRQNVHHFILDLVFEELRGHDPDVSDPTSSGYKEKCPNSYEKSRIGEANARDEHGVKLNYPLQGEDDDEEEVEIPASDWGGIENPIDGLKEPTLEETLAKIIESENEESNRESLNKLLETDGNMARILLSELFMREQLADWPKKNWIINEIASNDVAITNIEEFIDLLNLISPAETDHLLSTMPEEKLFRLTTSREALKTLRKKVNHVNILTILIDRFPDHFDFLLQQLIDTTNLTLNQKIKEQTADVRLALIDLHKSLQANKDEQGLVQVNEAVKLTEGLLRSTPENRAALVDAYKAQALIAGNRPSPFWRRASIAMMGLGLLLAAIGTICIFTGVGTVPGIAIAASGAVTFMSGATFFSTRRRTVQENMMNFADSIEKEEGELLLPAAGGI